MASTGIFNMVSVSAIQFADATADGSIPSTLDTVKIVAEGKFNPDFKAGSVTNETDELTQQVFRARRAPSTYAVKVDIPEVSVDQAAALLGGTANANELSVGATIVLPTNKYVVITGQNRLGKICTMKCYNCLVTTDWSGAVGANQATLALSVTLSLMLDNSSPAKMFDYAVGS